MLGLFLRFSSVSLFAIMAATAKYLGGRIPAGEIMAVRSAVGVATIVGLAWHTRNLQLLRTQNLGSHALRSSFGTFATFTWFLALNLIPIADATAISFAGPIFATLLAALLLRERIRAHRWLAVALGFGGVLVMTRSHLGHADASAAGALLALLCALFSALSVIFLRQMSRTEHPLTTTFYYSVTSLLWAAVTAGWGWPVPSGRDCLFLLLIGALGTSAQFLMTAALRYGEASILAPIEYTGIVVAAVLGYALFGDIPGVWIWLGTPLVGVAGLIIIWGEYRPPLPRRRARMVFSDS